MLSCQDKAAFLKVAQLCDATDQIRILSYNLLAFELNPKLNSAAGSYHRLTRFHLCGRNRPLRNSAIVLEGVVSLCRSAMLLSTPSGPCRLDYRDLSQQFKVA